LFFFSRLQGFMILPARKTRHWPSGRARGGPVFGGGPCSPPETVRKENIVKTRHAKYAPLVVLCVGVLLAPALAYPQDMVSEIVVINGGSAGIPPPLGYTKINVDLNRGAGGDFIYVCYKKGVGAPITGLWVTLGGGQPPSDRGFTRINVDLNRGAGGDFIWLWYTKDPACTMISNLAVIRGGSANILPPAGFTKINVDLNRGAGGDFIYLCYEEE
jgi:hypothetical protein